MGRYGEEKPVWSEAVVAGLHEGAVEAQYEEEAGEPRREGISVRYKEERREEGAVAPCKEERREGVAEALYEGEVEAPSREEGLALCKGERGEEGAVGQCREAIQALRLEGAMGSNKAHGAAVEGRYEEGVVAPSRVHRVVVVVEQWGRWVAAGPWAPCERADWAGLT